MSIIGTTDEAKPQARARGTFPRRSAGSTRRPTGPSSTAWCAGSRTRYAEDLAKRPSKHVYVGTLPAAVVDEIDRLRDSPIIRGLIAREVPAGSIIAPMKHTDELYLSHYNKDRGGDQGLFDKHYDGNLRFLASSIVVRALIYLQSDDTYKVVFDDSRVEKAFATYEFGLLDFHRELHWVEGHIQPGRPPAHPAEVQLPCNAARRRRVSVGPRSPPTPPCSTS